MSRILKKLNVDHESTIESVAPDLKLVPPLAAVSKPKKSLIKPLFIFTVISASLFLLYQKASPFFTELMHPSTPTTHPLIESVSAKAKLKEDDQIHQDAKDLFHAHDYAKALEKFEFLLKKYPGDAGLMNNVGLTQLKLNDLDHAEKSFQAVLKIEPKDSIAYNNLGTLKVTQLNWEEAIPYFYQAILYHPELVEPHLNLAKAFELAGRPMEAIPEYQYFLEHTKTSGSDPAMRTLIEKRIVKLNSFSRYIEQGE